MPRSTRTICRTYSLGQADARAAKKAEHAKKMIKSDAEWAGDDFVKQTEALARG